MKQKTKTKTSIKTLCISNFYESDIMENNLEDFLKRDMTKQVDDVLGINNNDAEKEYIQEYEDEYDDEFAEEMNDAYYYGRNAGEVLEELEENLDGEDNDNKKYILYKNKKLKVRFALIDEEGNFVFEDVKPETFDFLLLIGLDKKDVFYFDLMSKEEAEEKVKGSEIIFKRKDFKFGSHLDYKDIENYVERH